MTVSPKVLWVHSVAGEGFYNAIKHCQQFFPKSKLRLIFVVHPSASPHDSYKSAQEVSLTEKQKEAKQADFEAVVEGVEQWVMELDIPELALLLK